MKKIQVALASILSASALVVATPSNAAPLYDPSQNLGYVAVTQGSSSETTVRVPWNNSGTTDAKLVSVEGQAGLEASLLSATPKGVGNQSWLEAKLKVSHSFFKGAAFGNKYPLALTFEAGGSRCTVFVTVDIK